MNRGDLTNNQWARLQPLLPPEKPLTGRPNLDHRQIINGILWILRTGAPWEDLPARYGTRGTVSSGSTAGAKLASGTAFSPISKPKLMRTAPWIGPSISSIAPSFVPTSRPLVQKGDPTTEALGRSQGGFSTKVSVRAEGSGRPVAFILQPGQRHESQVFEQLMNQGAVKRSS